MASGNPVVNEIETLFIRIEANEQPAKEGYKRAENDAVSFANRITKIVSNTTKSVQRIAASSVNAVKSVFASASNTLGQAVIPRALMGRMASVGKAAGGMLVRGMVTALAAGGMVIGGAIGAIAALIIAPFKLLGNKLVQITLGALALYKLVDAWNDTRKAIEETANASKRLGISVRELSLLQGAAHIVGVEFETVNGAIQTMNNRLAEAAAGSGRGGGSSAATALGRLGLDAKQLMNMGVTERLKAIADGLQKVEGAANKSAILKRIFGGGAAGMGELLGGGGAGLSKMVKEAEALGVALSGPVANMVRMSNEGFRKMGLAVQGIKQQFTIALAPVLQAFAERIASWAKSFNDAKGGADGFARTLVGWFGKISDWIGVATVGFGQLSITFLQFIATGIQGIENLVNAVLGGISRLPGVELGQVNLGGQLANDLADGAQAALDKFAAQTPLSERINQIFKKVLADAQLPEAVGDAMATAFDEAKVEPTAVENFAKSLEQQLRHLEIEQTGKQFGLTDEQIKRWQQFADMQEELGRKVTQQELDTLNALEEQITAIEKRKKMEEDRVKAAKKAAEDLNRTQEQQASKARQLLEGALTPIQDLRRQIDEIRELEKIGALSHAQAAGIANKLVRDFAGKDAITATGGSAIRFGSAESEFSRQEKVQANTEKGVWELVDNAEVALETEKEILLNIKKMADNQPNFRLVDIR